MWGFGALLYEIWSLGCKPFEDMENNEVRAFTQSITIRQTTYIHAREAHNHDHIHNFTTGDQPRPNWLSLTPSTWVPKSNVLSNDILLVRMSLIHTYIHYCSARVRNICMWCSELMPTQPCSAVLFKAIAVNSSIQCTQDALYLCHHQHASTAATNIYSHCMIHLAS